jgi:uncharacterized protein YndB with AHSA1/START domain
MANKTVLTKDEGNKKIIVVREFDASVELVWNAWTQKELLDKWWAPKPWRAETKSMDFMVGGRWLYSMVGPDGTRGFSYIDFQSIDIHKSFSAIGSFCDESGNRNPNFFTSSWKNEFQKTATGTKVIIEKTFESLADMHKLIEMGFEIGFTAAHGNLDELLLNHK